MHGNMADGHVMPSAQCTEPCAASQAFMKVPVPHLEKQGVTMVRTGKEPNQARAKTTDATIVTWGKSNMALKSPTT